MEGTMGQRQSTKQSLVILKQIAAQHCWLVFAFAAQFCVVAGYSLITPFFPVIAKEKGMQDAEIGAVFAMYQATTFVASPIYGYLIVRLTPKSLSIVGTLLNGLSCIVFGLLDNVNNPVAFKVLCFSIRFLEGNGSAMLRVALASLVMTMFPDVMGKMLSAIEIVLGLAYLLGPFFGSILYKVAGYYLPFMVFGSLTIAVALTLIPTLPNIGEVSQEKENYLKLIRVPGFPIILLHCCVVTITFTSFEPVLSTWAVSKFDVTPVTVGYMTVGAALAYCLGAGLIGFLVDKGHLYWIMIVGLFVNAAIYFLLGPSPLLPCAFLNGGQIFPVVIILLAAHGFFSVFIAVPPYKAGVHLVRLDGYEPTLRTYGIVAGLVNSCLAAGSFIGPLLSGFVTQYYGFPWAMSVAGIIIAVMGVIMSGFVAVMKITKRALTLPESVTPTGDSELSTLLPND